MGKYLFKRAIRGVVTLVGIMIVVFLITHAIGDPALLMMPDSYTNEMLWYTRESLGLNKPLIAQFGDFVFNALKGDFGRSIRHEMSSRTMLFNALVPTLILATAALILTAGIGVPMGVVAALKPRSWMDSSVTGISLGGISLPEFWLSLVFIALFAVKLHLLPTSGYGSLPHVVLPAIVLSARPISRVAQITRSSMLDELGKHYTVTAYAKGLRKRQVVIGHVLKNAGIGIISMVGIEAAEVFAGRTVICEVIFSWPGVGWLAYRALFSMDFPLIQTVVLWAALVTVVVNLITDIAYAWFDPRIRYA